MRIMMATSGMYYVQKMFPGVGWRKVGGFFNTRSGARKFAEDYNYTAPYNYQKVVEYVY